MHPIMLTRLAPAAGTPEQTAKPENTAVDLLDSKSDADPAPDFAAVLQDTDAPKVTPTVIAQTGEDTSALTRPSLEGEVQTDAALAAKSDKILPIEKQNGAAQTPTAPALKPADALNTDGLSNRPVTASTDQAQKVQTAVATEVVPPVTREPGRPENTVAAPTSAVEQSLRRTEPAIPKTMTPVPDEGMQQAKPQGKTATIDATALPVRQTPPALKAGEVTTTASNVAQMAFAKNTAPAAEVIKPASTSAQTNALLKLQTPAADAPAVANEIRQQPAPLVTNRIADIPPLKPPAQTTPQVPSDALKVSVLPMTNAKTTPAAALDKAAQIVKDVALSQPGKQTPIPFAAAPVTPFQERRAPSAAARTDLADTPIAATTQIKVPPKPAFSTLVPIGEASKSIAGQTQLTPLTAFAEAEPLVMARGDTSVGGTVAPHAAMPTRIDMAHHMSRQVAEALQHMPSRPVEISLNPDELGRVKLGISSSEAGIVVSVLAERPETIDLMRRHINSLEAAFQAIGYSDISFSFAGGDTQNPSEGDHQSGQFGNGTDEATAPENTPQTIHLNTQAGTGLDLRL